MLKRLRQRIPTWDVLWCEVWNLFKFGVVGLTSLGLNAGIYALLSRVIWTTGPRTLESVIAVTVASIYNFSLHRAWTFQAKAFNASMIARYLLVGLGGVSLHGTLFYIGHEVFGWYDLGVLIGAAFLVAGGTYSSHRWFTFHPRHDISHSSAV